MFITPSGSFFRGITRVASILSICGIAGLSGCQRMKVQVPTPFGPGIFETEPVAPGTTVPPANAPATQLPHPVAPGRTVDVIDTNGDGIFDWGFDPITKRWYRLIPVPNEGGGPIDQQRQMTMSFSDDGPVHSDPPDPEPGNNGYHYEFDGCPLDVGALPWGAETAEEFIVDHGLDVSAGNQTTVNGLAVTHSFDSEGDADVTLYWSTSLPVVNPMSYELCYAMHALPGQTGADPSGMQIRVRGDWHRVAGWLVAMGIKEFSIPVDGVTWTLISVPNQNAVEIEIEGVYVETVSLN